MTLRLMVVLGVGIAALAIVAGMADYYGFLSLGRTAVLSGNEVDPTGLRQSVSCVRYPETERFITARWEVINPDATDRTITTRFYYNSKNNGVTANAPSWARTLNEEDIPASMRNAYNFDSGVEWAPVTIPKATSRGDLLAKVVTYSIDVHPKVPNNTGPNYGHYKFVTTYEGSSIIRDGHWQISKCADNEAPTGPFILARVDVSPSWVPPGTATPTPKPTVTPFPVTPTVTPTPRVTSTPSTGGGTPASSGGTSTGTTGTSGAVPPPAIFDKPQFLGRFAPTCYQPGRPLALAFQLKFPVQLQVDISPASILLPAGEVGGFLPKTGHHDQAAGSNHISWDARPALGQADYSAVISPSSDVSGPITVPFVTAYVYPSYPLARGSIQESIRVEPCASATVPTTTDQAAATTPVPTPASVITKITDFFTGSSTPETSIPPVITAPPQALLPTPSPVPSSIIQRFTGLFSSSPTPETSVTPVLVAPTQTPPSSPSIIQRFTSLFSGSSSPQSTPSPSPAGSPQATKQDNAKDDQETLTPSASPAAGEEALEPDTAPTPSPFRLLLQSLSEQALSTVKSLITTITNWQGVANKGVE